MAIEKQKLILIAGLVLGVAAVAMTKVYLDQQKEAVQIQAKKAIANMQANQSAVLTAKQDISKGTAIVPDLFETAIVPNKFVQPQAATSIDRIAGMVTVAPISKGEQITLSKLANAKQAGGKDLAGITPAGKRAIGIAVDNLASLSGMIKPGDYVDVIALLPVPTQGPDGKPVSQVAVVPLFQNVLILAVGQNTGDTMSRPSSGSSRYAEKDAQVSSGSPMITLALAPREASLIAFVQEQGKIRLTLRSPADAQVEPIALASWDTLFQYIMPPKPAPAQVEEKEKQTPVVDTTEYVEVFRGLNKEKVALSK